MRLPLALSLLLVLIPAAMAQTAPEASGHWEGAISTPTQELRILVDLARDGQQAWKGTIGVPEQNLKAFPLSGITVQSAKVHFAMAGVPGDPQFDGTLAADGKTLAGDWTQGGGAVPAKLTRTGEAKFEPVAKSTAIDKAFEGTWDGTLDANGTTLRLVVKLANQAGGAATGSITSVDQGNAEIPIGTITQKDSNIILELPSVAGTYNGDINPAGTEIKGEWTQGGGKLPLVLKRPAK